MLMDKKEPCFYERPISVMSDDESYTDEGLEEKIINCLFEFMV